ncbi:MAG: hypothetical protein ACJ790_04445 [Myxococcaceae bacterium]
MEEDRAKEREERIAELERKLASSRPVGVKPWVAAVCIFGAFALAWLDRSDIAYFFSSREPVTLGMEGDYRVTEIAPNCYVQLHGAPTSRAIYAEEHGQESVIVGFRDSPFLVKRHALPGEERFPGKPPPPPSQTPFGVRGRLMTRAMDDRFGKAFDDFKSWGEVHPKDGQLFLIVEGEKPGTDAGLGVLLAVLVAFVALNAYFLVRALRVRR